MPKSALPYLFHIRDSIGLIETYISGYTLKTFGLDHKTWDAVVKQIENIGEEVNKLEKGYLIAHPELPWRDMVATRNKLTHDYWDINPKRVWEIATLDIPTLKLKLVPLIVDIQKQETS